MRETRNIYRIYDGETFLKAAIW